jgi:MinD-like ATPase involved in chromosome partitioning or flagellar assembly
MTAPNGTEKRGIVYTFYSYKGGVGRTMALANAAALLAKWGHSVLVVDWDLEAPGLERFFAKLKSDIHEVRAQTLGIVDLIEAGRNGTCLDWRDGLIKIDLGRLSLLTAGRNGESYTSRLHSLDFNDLFENHDLGAYIEKLRSEWISEFDFVLVDSRTGFTDIGGICTVHLADVLVLFFTTTESSVTGALSVVERARKAQERLPLDRRRLLAVPVPARDESRTEYKSAAEWKATFAHRFADLYRDWLPSGMTPRDAIEQLRIPYIPYWSFGERLPALEESTSDPANLGHAYEILARMLAARLDWYAALQGETPAPPPMPRRPFNEEWLERHRKAAEEGLANSGLKGFMEVLHFSPDSSISKAQGDLLAAARQAQTASGWPAGMALNGGDAPKAMNDGIVASFSGGARFSSDRRFVYWTLAKNGDFYTLASLLEDKQYPNSDVLWLDGCIRHTAEALDHCVDLYKALGVEPNAHIEIAIRYRGMRGRTLRREPPSMPPAQAHTNSLEDEVPIPPVVFRLGDIDSQMLHLVKKLCEPLFVLFDFASFKDEIYEKIVSDFVAGRQ